MYDYVPFTLEEREKPPNVAMAAEDIRNHKEVKQNNSNFQRKTAKAGFYRQYKERLYQESIEMSKEIQQLINPITVHGEQQLK